MCSLEHSDVITINGTLSARNARLLLDSGANGNFISQSYIKQYYGCVRTLMLLVKLSRQTQRMSERRMELNYNGFHFN